MQLNGSTSCGGRKIIPKTLKKKSFIFILFNPNNCHWILVVLNTSERVIAVLYPFETDTHWTYTSVQRGYRIGLSLMQIKFGLTDVKQVSIRYVKQPDNRSCDVLVCYYAEQIISGILFLYFFDQSFSNSSVKKAFL